MEVEKVQLVFVIAWPTFQERNFMIFLAKSCFYTFCLLQAATWLENTPGE
jgi:hypothetical protein